MSRITVCLGIAVSFVSLYVLYYCMSCITACFTHHSNNFTYLSIYCINVCLFSVYVFSVHALYHDMIRLISVCLTSECMSYITVCLT